MNQAVGCVSFWHVNMIDHRTDLSFLVGELRLARAYCRDRVRESVVRDEVVNSGALVLHFFRMRFFCVIFSLVCVHEDDRVVVALGRSVLVDDGVAVARVVRMFADRRRGVVVEGNNAERFLI